MSNRYGIDFTKEQEAPARPSGNGAKIIKFEQEIDMQEFINEGRDGTEIQDIVNKAGGIDKLAAMKDKTDQGDETINLGMNFIQANKILKIAQIKQKKLEKETAIKAELEKIEKDNKKIKKEEDNE